jgi:membrane protein DedA with SNARE-associated domain
MHAFVEWLVGTIGALGYPGIFLLMAMESSVIPVPSELVMPPAGYLAQQGQMNAYLAVFWGTVGSLVGAYANYYAAHYLGRPLVLRYGRYVGISEHKFAKVERFFLEANQEHLLGYQAAGSIVRIDFPAADLAEYTHDLLDRARQAA